MVGQVSHYASQRVGNAVSHRRTRMAYVRGRDAEFADFDLRVVDFMQMQVARQFAKPDRKQRRRQIALESSTQTELSACGPPDVYFAIGPVKRREEAEPLNVVHVKMREQH